MEVKITTFSLIYIISAVLGAPLIFGVINKTKAFFAGRTGQPLFQLYFDLVKLWRKDAVYSRTTSWIFRAGPVVQLACVLTALALLPLGTHPALLAFPGDFIVLAGLLALMRFSIVAAALDTGSSFEGMGASREVTFSAVAEPAFLLSLAALAHKANSLSLSGFFSGQGTVATLLLISLALFAVFLAENARMPVDDPNTHLELTMIHEVMVLDYSGPDFAFILYAAALKLWILGTLLISVIFQGTSNLVMYAVGMLGLGVLTGIIESVMARLRLIRVPQLLIGAGALSALALILEFANISH